MIFESFVSRMQSHVSRQAAIDPAHDVDHVRRVVAMARALAVDEHADLDIVIPAAWLHDLAEVPKDSPERANASAMAARRAIEWLNQIGYPNRYLDPIGHAIEAHSFSAGVTPQTIEAQVVQDADRLDAIGAIGIARCFATAGAMGSQLFASDDPFCLDREPQDKRYAVDHFYNKLLTLEATMQTHAGRREAGRRTAVMRQFLDQLKTEVTQRAAADAID